MQLGTTYQCRYPTRHQDGGTERTEERGRVVSSQRQKGDDEMEGGGPAPPERPGPTDEERIEQACDLYERERQRADCLEQEIEALRLGQ